MKLSDNIQLELETDEAYALYRLLNYRQNGQGPPLKEEVVKTYD